MLSRKRVEMFARVAEWERSSMSLVAFSRTCGITERQFYYWAQKVREATMSSDDNPEFNEIVSIGQTRTTGQTLTIA